MLLPDTADTVQVEMIFTQRGEKVENVYHVNTHADLNVDDLNTLAGVFIAWWATNLQSSTTNSVSLDLIVAKNLSSRTAPAIEFSTGLPLVGTITTAAPPANVTTVVKWLSTIRGRSYRGRTYHIGLTNAQIVDGLVTSIYASELQASYEALLASMVTLGYSLCVVSYFADKVMRSAGLTTDIISCTVGTSADSQRRRLI